MKQHALSWFSLLLLFSFGISLSEAQVGSSIGMQADQSSRPSPGMIAGALHCMEMGKNAKATAKAEPKDAYIVKYLYGVVDRNVDKPNELHLISYGKDGRSAWLFELLAERAKEGTYCLTWINSARLSRKRGRWDVDETLGGVYSYNRVNELVNKINQQKQLSVSSAAVKSADVTCKSQ